MVMIRSRQMAAWCLAFLISLLFVGVAWAEPVKRLRSAICHCPGGAYYARTKHFSAFGTIEACLQSGGRHPKQGQGNCRAAGQTAIPLSTPIEGTFTGIAKLFLAVEEDSRLS